MDQAYEESNKTQKKVGKIPVMLTTIAAKAEIANLVQAKLYREQTSIRYSSENEDFLPYPLCSTSLKILGKYGIGLQLYFTFIKQAAILFFFLSLLALYPSLNNYFAKKTEKDYIYQTLTYFTLANHEKVSRFETDINKANDINSKSEDYLEKYWILDFIMNLIFIGFAFVYAWQSKKAVVQAGGNNLSISDFAIEVQGFPPYITSEEVHEFFSSYGQIAEIYLSRYYEGKLPKYKKIYEIAYELGIRKKTQFHFRKTGNITLPPNILDNIIVLDHTHDELLVDKIFVVFENAESKNHCLRYNSMMKKLSFWHSQSLKRKDKEIVLNMRTPPNPSDILWENLEYNYIDLLKVRIPILIVTIAVIILSFIGIYGIKAYYNTTPSEYDCTELNIDPSISLDEAKTSLKNTDEIYCYCKWKIINTVIYNNDAADYCKDCIHAYYILSITNFMVSLCIVAVNSLLKLIINLLSKYERFRSKTEKRNYIFVSLFFLMYFNTAITTLLANSNFSIGISKLQGRYTNLTREWYDDVGYSLTVTMIVSIFSPHVFELLILWPIGILKRKLCSKCFKSQYKLNKFFRGPSFDISDSLAQALVVVFTTYTYSAGMPMLIIICFVSLILTYWCKKILILRHNRTPPVYSYNLNTRLVFFLPVAVVFHCIFAIFAYSSPEIFPFSYKKSQKTGYIVPNHLKVLDVIKRDSTIANGIIIILCLVSMILLKNFDMVYKKLSTFNRVSAKNSCDLYSFSQLKESGKLSGLNTYNIYENPAYKTLIHALDSVARKHKKMFSEKDSLIENPPTGTPRAENNEIVGENEEYAEWDDKAGEVINI